MYGSVFVFIFIINSYYILKKPEARIAKYSITIIGLLITAIVGVYYWNNSPATSYIGIPWMCLFFFILFLSMGLVALIKKY